MTSTAGRSLTLPAPAKLNLFLHITGRRGDGYHELQTLFQLLDYGDTLDFALRDDAALQLRIEGADIPDTATDDNLVLRAARLLATIGERDLPGVDITLHKRLPAGGGLGGGSSDAASTLLALNQLWQLNLEIDRLAEIGARLGADVPVFVRGNTAWAEGVGEKLSPVSLRQRWFLVVHPGCSVSTAEVFSHPQLTRNTPVTTIAAFFAGDTRNDCENLVRQLAEPVHNALIFLQNFGEPALTGTGACVFLALDDEGEARAALDQLPQEWAGFVARGVNRSPALTVLENG